MARPAADRDVWFKFYPTDWRGDEGLRLCSLAARGLWMEILTLVHRTDGYLLVNDRKPDAATLARLVGSTPAEIKKLLAELKGHGVYSERPDDGVIFSRRMVRDAKRRAVNRANGSQGGNPGLLLQKSDNRNADESDNRNGNRLDRNSDNTQKLEARSQTPEPEETQGQEQRADARESHSVLVRLAHDVLADIDAGVLDPHEAKTELKVRAAQARIVYDATAVTKALDSAEKQRQRRPA